MVSEMKEIKDLASMIRRSAGDLTALADKLEREGKWSMRKWMDTCEPFIDALVDAERMMTAYRDIRFSLNEKERK